MPSPSSFQVGQTVRFTHNHPRARALSIGSLYVVRDVYYLGHRSWSGHRPGWHVWVVGSMNMHSVSLFEAADDPSKPLPPDTIMSGDWAVYSHETDGPFIQGNIIQALSSFINWDRRFVKVDIYPHAIVSERFTKIPPCQ